MVKTEEKALKELDKFAENLLEQLNKKEAPSFQIPSRTRSNVEFDKEKEIIDITGKKSTRSFINASHVRKFMQTLLVAKAAEEYIKNDRTVTKRELYYNLKRKLPGTSKNTWEDDDESSAVIEDLEATLGLLRQQMNISAKSRGSIYGDITIKQAGDEFSCKKLGKGGWAIPGNVEDVEIVDYNAERILFIETEAMQSRLIEEGAYDDLDTLLITGQGMAPRGVKRFLKRLQEETDLPVIAFTDGDPFGFYIYSVLKHGSMGLSHVNDHYAVPNSKFVGMTMDDIDEYGLENVTEELDEQARKKIEHNMNYEWFKYHPEWIEEMKKMKEKGVRIEQQALANKSLEFVAETYLPEKIENEEFLP